MNATVSKSAAQSKVSTSVRAMSEEKGDDKRVKRNNTYLADPRLLFILEGYNVRRTEQQRSREQIEALKGVLRDFIAKSAHEKSPLNLKPVVGEIGVFLNKDLQLQVWDGYHRTTAIMELIAEGYEIPWVPIDERPADDRAVLVAMLRSGMSLNHTPLEKAIGYARLADEQGMRATDIADEVGTTPQRVEQLLLLGRADSEIHDLVADNKLSADAAIELIRKHREAALEEIKKAVSGGGRVGKGITRMAMPKKTQDGVFTAVRSSAADLERQLGEHRAKAGDNWKSEMVAVSLPAEIVAELLAKASKAV